MLMDLADISDRVAGIEMGADDFLVKPFSFKEFEVRMMSLMRRTTKTLPLTGSFSSGCLFFGKIKIDLDKRQVYKKAERIRLTGMEFSLLELLISRSGGGRRSPERLRRGPCRRCA